jgi:hypothetical protein
MSKSTSWRRLQPTLFSFQRCPTASRATTSSPQDQGPLLAGEAYRLRRHAPLRRTGRELQAFSTLGTVSGRTSDAPSPLRSIADPWTDHRSLQPSQLPTLPRKGKHLRPDQDASTVRDLRGGAVELTPLDEVRWPDALRSDALWASSLDGFTSEAVAPLDSPPGIACR